MLKYLIESKANMKKTTSDKETVFHISALWDRVKSAQFLIDQGLYEEPYLKNIKGFTAFELAVSKEMKTILSYK
jgi:ankyrin repeat protein